MLSLPNSGLHITSALIISIGLLCLPYSLLRSRTSNTNDDSGTILPLCTQHILDKRFYQYSLNSRNVAMKPIQDPPCRLAHYQEAETVQCFDSLLNDMKTKQSAGLLDEGDTGEMVLSFVGDSRIRQLYAERLKVLPFLDEAIHEPNRHYHNDFRSYVPIFDKQLIFDFNWTRYLTDNDLMQSITEWADEPNLPNKTNQVIPHFLLLGVSPWYMIASSNLTHLDYEQHLMELYPILERLSLRMKERSNGKIVWMMQYPSFIDHGNIVRPVDDNSVKITTAKLDNYNSIARRIFRNSSVIQVWDTLLPIMEDHIRGCLEFNRSAPFFLRTWKDCSDTLHGGYVAYSQAFQFILNFLCNDVMSSTNLFQ